MGERLAKEADALLKAKIEQNPLWHKAMQEGSTTPAETTKLMLALFRALQEVVLHIAREVEDLPRGDDA
ncbi:MAG TPA: hypothetical protein VN892_00090 [Solirubrobacteraceae bacterium]|nr:hypothetical protein [Solirubrobacteraceae bacterium]